MLKLSSKAPSPKNTPTTSMYMHLWNNFPALCRLMNRYRFLGEETYSKGASRDYLIEKDSPTWCVDPLDGTVNYTHLFPMFCVSIGFIVGGEPVMGVICAPFLNQLFSACRGRGAWLNETQRLPLIRDPVPPMPANAPGGCIFSCEWGKYRKVDSFLNMAAEVGGRGGKGGMVHGVRSLGRYVWCHRLTSGILEERLSNARKLVLHWTWHIRQWGPLTSGGKAGAGNGKCNEATMTNTSG
jgi:hypothetical protein